MSTKLTGIERSKIEDEAISEVGYDPFTKVIEIAFRNGKVKQVQGVTVPHWESIRSSGIIAHLQAILRNPSAFSQRDV